MLIPDNKQLIIATGKGEEAFACSFLYSGKLNTAEELLQLMMNKKLLFRDWVETITVIEGDEVKQFYTNKNWKS